VNTNPGTRRLVAVVALAATILGQAPVTSAHDPDPLLGTGTPWAQNQLLNYQWASGQVPPAWLATAIDQGAADSNATRGSQAAIYARADTAPSKIAYGGAVPCSSYGIACMNRSGVPDSFGVWFRPHGAVLDWGTLRWCQAQSSPTNGCYDARRVALDEFGHVQLLGHHVNYADESDYLDAVVQFAGRSRPKEGWNTHVFGTCDVARLQLEYELIRATDPVSTCLSLATSLTVATDYPNIVSGYAAEITGELEIAAVTAARRLSGDPLSRRSITIQRRYLGSTTWAVIGTMFARATDGAYVITVVPQATADYRLNFDAPSSEGLRDSTSGIVRITVSSSGSCVSTPNAKEQSIIPPC
jgi:hypothetical protein